MPWPGPVAYHVQPGGLTAAVMSTGPAQVAPSSSLRVSHTVRGASPAQIRSSPPSARFWQKGNRMAPLAASTTGAGLPQVMPRRLTTT